MNDRCPTCGKKLYQKKGYNKASLKNLVSFGHERKIKPSKKCVLCDKKRCSNSLLCLEHLSKRRINLE